MTEAPTPDIRLEGIPAAALLGFALFLVAIALALGNVLWQYRSAKRTRGVI